MASPRRREEVGVRETSASGLEKRGELGGDGRENQIGCVGEDRVFFFFWNGMESIIVRRYKRVCNPYILPNASHHLTSITVIDHTR